MIIVTDVYFIFLNMIHGSAYVTIYIYIVIIAKGIEVYTLKYGRPDYVFFRTELWDLHAVYHNTLTPLTMLTIVVYTTGGCGIHRH